MLKIENITKTFNSGTAYKVEALKAVDLEIDDGSFVCILGTNGSGKSTLLNAIAGCFLPDLGTIVLDNNDITKWDEHRRAKLIGRVFQNPFSGTAPNMSIMENLSLAFKRGKTRGIGWGLPKSLISDFENLVRPLNMGLEERLGNPIGKLSGGQRQALTLLMATAIRPKLLLLDEHTAALDPKTATKVIDLTKQIIERDNLTTLMVTHSMQQAVSLGNRLIMMHQGKIAYDFKGDAKKHLKVQDLLQLFDQLRKNDNIDIAVTNLLTDIYV